MNNEQEIYFEQIMEYLRLENLYGLPIQLTKEEKERIKELLKDDLVLLIYEAGYSNGYELS